MRVNHVTPRAPVRRKLHETEDAYDAAQYFIDDVKDPWQADAVERERTSQHAQLRELVVRGDAATLQTKLTELGSAAGIVANLTPGGANTLLYVASELGATTAAAALVEAGADGRAHPVTRYGPLYIACYHGHLDIAKLLLHHFPEAIQQETVEKWLPLHAACIGGHPAVVTLLLEYPYPDHLLSTYT
ncbi:unnamed protein product [Euphydryas editha]|uniref:Uncharacterized protein n=1 Tax=Euphydryas editha TaxID=104508 RepID=A0AAU9UVH3_EUPED|nr:unnamed protein product [Euphydryas editha]